MSRLLIAALLATACAPRLSSSQETRPLPGAPIRDGGTDRDAGITAGVRDIDLDAGFPGIVPVALDSLAKALFAESPDEQHLVVSHQALSACDCDSRTAQPACAASDDVELFVVDADAGTTRLAGPGRWARFLAGGRFLAFGSGACEAAASSYIARADGTGARPGPQYRFGALWPAIGPWLYYFDESGAYRLHELDGEPELVVSGRLYDFEPARDGEAVLYCETANECHLQSPVDAEPVAVPQAFWFPDGMSLWSDPCTVLDRFGKVLWSCDATLLTQPPQVWGGEAVSAFVGHDGGRYAVHVHEIATGAETVLPLPSFAWIRLTPDHSRVLAGLPADGTPYGTNLSAILSAPASGGTWTRLADDVTRLAVSSDSRVVAMASQSRGLLVSVDGGAARAIGAPGLTLVGIQPEFEPDFGLAQALFVEADPGSAASFHAVLGNADGSGGWVRLPPGSHCEWAAHTAVCHKANPAGGYDIALVADHGALAGTIARRAQLSFIDTAQWPFQRGRRRLYYLDSSGLFAVENPRP